MVPPAQGRNVVLESKYGSPKIVNDGVTIATEVELEDPVENIGAKLVRQAAARTNVSGYRIKMWRMCIMWQLPVRCGHIMSGTCSTWHHHCIGHVRDKGGGSCWYGGRGGAGCNGD